MPKTAKKWGFESFFEKKCRKNLPVSKMAVILHRFSTEISSSGLGRRPLTAETRVRVPVSLPSKAFSIRAGGFLVCCDKASARSPMPGSPCQVPRVRFPVPQLSCGPLSLWSRQCGPCRWSSMPGPPCRNSVAASLATPVTLRPFSHSFLQM